MCHVVMKTQTPARRNVDAEEICFLTKAGRDANSCQRGSADSSAAEHSALQRT